MFRWQRAKCAAAIGFDVFLRIAAPGVAFVAGGDDMIPFTLAVEPARGPAAGVTATDLRELEERTITIQRGCCCLRVCEARGKGGFAGSVERNFCCARVAEDVIQSRLRIGD